MNMSDYDLCKVETDSKVLTHIARELFANIKIMPNHDAKTILSIKTNRLIASAKMVSIMEAIGFERNYEVNRASRYARLILWKR